MPTLTVSNRTRSAITLPATPPVVLASAQSQTVSLADITVPPGGTVSVLVNIAEIDSVEAALRALQTRGIIYVAVTQDSVSLLSAGVYGEGMTGPQGDAGIQGDAGLQGQQGWQGTQGNDGFQGLQGRQGIVGTQGPQGGP